ATNFRGCHSLKFDGNKIDQRPKLMNFRKTAILNDYGEMDRSPDPATWHNCTSTLCALENS
ncbi:hypothetical protein Q5O12_28580, partial [Klebsiella pneumoniae]|uniref:hypothetical protein n=1 Tax=Klebsiella pneumoniae TaxID=573 RepID=UPI00272FAFD8